mmetsp:Transcript_37196/g.68895  ORF Transcript_37196/g.68895 Transcript_37196/m.68895 type:complete len:666 (+) Transcript_37196:61-2058(+)
MGSTAGQGTTSECAVSTRKSRSQKDGNTPNGGKGCHSIDDDGGDDDDDDNTSSSSSSSSSNKTPSDEDDGSREKLCQNHGSTSKTNNGNNAANNDEAVKNRSTNPPSADAPNNNATKVTNARHQRQPQPNNIQTITIGIEDVASSIVSIVDPWVPRIRNNDEYLKRGLDLSPKSIPTILNKDDNDANDAGDNDYGQEGQNEIRQREQNYYESAKLSSLVGNVGATRLAYALSYNTRLLTLNLSRNDIGTEGGVALAKSLYGVTNHSSSSSNNNNNPNNSNSSDAFRSKTALRVINLSHNLIGNDGAMAFSQALRHNTSLTELNLSDNEIGFEGMLTLMEGLKKNITLKRLGLVDNIRRNLSRGEMAGFSYSVGRVLLKGVLQESALEVLEMHGSDNSGRTAARDHFESALEFSEVRNDGRNVDDTHGGSHARDNFDRLSEEDARHLERSIYGMEAASERTSYSSARIRLKHHRMRTLTLPGIVGDDIYEDDETERIVHRLRRILRFNAYYRPVLRRHDVLDSPLAKAEAALNVPIKLPHRLRRDYDDDDDNGGSGALIALLPSSFSDVRSSHHAASGVANGNDGDARGSSLSRPSSSKGVEYRMMPRVLSFAGKECTLDVVWNLVRYRPDVFCCTGGGMVVVGCAPCRIVLRGGRSGNGGGCCIS